ncbi:MAG TPA: tetratricopeptide repeat protein [Clostridia bacterium]|nr:tetratricopeptide repeat protein [Clostridia bacterium]
MEINPQDADAWFGKGNALENMGKYEEATKTYRKAMEIEPHNINYGISKNNVIEKLGRHEVASAFYKKLWN